MEVDAYLQRIHTEQMDKANLHFLEILQFQHLLTVPFENLDVMDGVPIPLNLETYYQKVIEKGRGGFCYELNGLFQWLLEKVGFQSHLVSATIQRPDGTWAKAESHAAQIVYLDQAYLVDVGFGDSARTPLPISGEVRSDVSGKYRIVHVQDDVYDVQRANITNEWRTLYRFDTLEKKLGDFAEVCHFNQTSPESHFTQKLIVTLAKKSGRVTLSGNELTETSQGEKQKKHIEVANMSKVLEKTFGIYK